MILINKGVKNDVIVTVTEKVTLAIPYFLFRFVSDATNVEYAFIMPNISIYKDRYDKFELTEGDTVTLEPNGFYHYYIYEQDNDSNLDYTLTTSLLEVGKVDVVSATITEPITEFISADEYKTFE